MLAQGKVPDPGAEAARDLIQRHFGPCTELDRRYVGVMTWEGWAYLATVIDLARRKVVGWALADHTCAPNWSKRPSRWPSSPAEHRRGRSSTPRGKQYTRTDYAGLAHECKVVLSVGMAGECWDKAVADRSSPPSSASSSRPELGTTRAGLRRGAFDYIEGWYNTRQLHSSLGYLSPAGYEARISDSVGRQAA